ncbi:hypothetical protein BKC07_01420 [Peribacillus simplex]|nr:hypothetical protein BKC07_01420 [Peribacillus simplex]
MIPLQALAFRGRSLPLFPAGVSYLPFQSTGTFFKRNIVGKLALLQFVYILGGFINFSTKGVSDCLALNQGFKNKLDFLSFFFTA